MTNFSQSDGLLSRLDVAVLCGGPGAERDVSLQSGGAVHDALRRGGFAARKIEIPPTGHEECVERLECQVAVMMLHGEFGEDGHAQAILERRGIAFTGSSAEVCALAMDKAASKELFRRCGVPTPDWLLLKDSADCQAAAAASGLVPPLVVKPNARGSSVGVSIIRDLASLTEAVDRALEVDDAVLVEPFVEGRELTLGWLNGELLPLIELIPDGGFYDYNAKYVSDKTQYICPAKLDRETEGKINAIGQKVFEIMSVRDLSRVDILLGPSSPVVLEVNTSPGFTSHSLVPLAARTAGMDMENLCRKLVTMAAFRGGLV